MIRSRLLVLLLCMSAVAPAFSADEERVSLISELQLKHKIPEHEAAEQVERIFTLIKEDLRSGKSIEVRNFGKFAVAERKVRQKKKESFQGPLPEAKKKRYARFLPADSLKEDLNSLGG